MSVSEGTNDDLWTFLRDEIFVDEEDESEANNVSDISSGETPSTLNVNVNVNVVIVVNPIANNSLNNIGNGDVERICATEKHELPFVVRNRNSSKKKLKLARDIRETYGEKILKAINEVDFPPLLALLNSICCPSACLFVNRQSKKPHADSSLYSACFEGPLKIAQYYYGIMTMEPDAVITLKKSKFHPESPRGLIVIKLEYRATKMYNVETTYGAIAETVGSGIGNPTDNLDMSTLVEQVHEIRDHLPTRKKAVKVFTKGLIRAYTNQDKRITQILMDLNLIENDFSVEK